jgi:transposase-like protein
MKATYTDAFREQAVAKVYSRGDRTIRSIATELDVKYHTLKNWMKPKIPHKPGAAEAVRRPQDWSAPERLQALCESHDLNDDTLGAWCRRHGLYPHHLQAWRDAFEHGEPRSASASRSEFRELKEENKQLERELKRKEKALAEAAALLVLQKKFQALWEDKDA